MGKTRPPVFATTLKAGKRARGAEGPTNPLASSCASTDTGRCYKAHGRYFFFFIRNPFGSSSSSLGLQFSRTMYLM